MEKPILVLIIIVCIKGIFSASEVAFLFVNKYKISQLSKKNKKALRIKQLISKPNKIYGIIETGIIMSELLASVYAGEIFVDRLQHLFMRNEIPQQFAIIFSVLIVTVVLSYILIIFGAIIPKKIARNNPEKIAYRLIYVLEFFAYINTPFEILIEKSAHIFCKIFHIKEHPENKLTEKEIKLIIAEGRDQGIIAKEEKEILYKTLKFNDIKVKQIMTPKENMDYIHIKDSKDKILEHIKEHKYTRIPVYEGNEDNIVGILNIKDIMIAYATNKNISINVKQHLRDVIFVEKEQKIVFIFKKMQEKHQSIAIVLDEKQKVVGLITMEDIVEKIVGNIIDEYER